MTVSVPNPSEPARREREYIPNGWTAKIVDGETVFRSPTGGIETTDIDVVQEKVRVHQEGR